MNEPPVPIENRRLGGSHYQSEPSAEQIISLHLANLSSRQHGHSTGYAIADVRRLVIDWLLYLFSRPH